MARPVAIGLKKFYMGDVAVDGGMGTGLSLVSNAVIDTPVLNIPEGETTNFEIEDSDDPFYSKTTPGVKTLNISFYVADVNVLEQFFGGVAVVGPASGADTWEAPLQIQNFEASIVAEHQQGGHMKIVRALVAATADWNFQKNNLPQINVVATILTPTKTNTAPISFSTADYTP